MSDSDREDRMRAAVEKLARYWGTYDEQAWYTRYTTDTLINDALYGIGLALDELEETDQYRGPGGFSRLKSRLRYHMLTKDNAVSHRHEGWEGSADACPICRAHDAQRRAEKRELEAAAECDNMRAERDEYGHALDDARAVIQAAVDAARPLMPFVMANVKHGGMPDE